MLLTFSSTTCIFVFAVIFTLTFTLGDFVFSIIYSANINDRSMLGKRDSEMAAVIQDKEFVSHMYFLSCEYCSKSGEKSCTKIAFDFFFARKNSFN